MRIIIIIPPPLASRRGEGYSGGQFRPSVHVCVCNKFAALRRDPCCTAVHSLLILIVFYVINPLTTIAAIQLYRLGI